MTNEGMCDDLISIIIPIYNRAEYLKKCVESVLGQTYFNIEIILINDGSTDDSGKICRHYADIDKRVRYYEQENRGISAARNAGIGHATGKYYSFIDADDFVSDRYIEILYHSLIEHDADISIGSYSMVAADQLPDFSSDGSDICITGREAIL